jgi:hypothetical protein
MRPTQSDVHVNTPLTSILIAYFQDEAKGIANKVFPVVPVSHKTDTYYQWTREDWNRITAAERAPGTQSEGGDFGLSTTTYNALEYAVHKDLDDPTTDNQDEVLDLESAAARWVGFQLALKREKLWHTTYFTTSVWDTDQTGVAGVPGANQFKQWDQTGSTPIEDLENQLVAVEEATGYRPNKLVLGPHVWKILKNHPELIDRIKYTQRGIVGTELLAALLEIDSVYIARLIENTANEGQTESNSFIASKSALLLYAASAPSKLTPSAGYTFAWTKRFGAGPQGERIKKFRMEEIESDRIEGQMNFDQKVIATDLGKFFASAVA